MSEAFLRDWPLPMFAEHPGTIGDFRDRPGRVLWLAGLPVRGLSVMHQRGLTASGQARVVDIVQPARWSRLHKPPRRAALVQVRSWSCRPVPP
jgi:hypothetical protein